MANINFKGDDPIDFKGIRKLLDSMRDDCEVCNHAEKKKAGNLCPGCCFGSNSTYGNRRRVYPKETYFKQFGLKNLPSMGKHMLFWFLNREHLEFQWPEIPDEDLFGNITEEKAISLGLDLTKKEVKDRIKKFLWHIHHENREYWNDKEENTMLTLNTEHPKFDVLNRHEEGE